MGPRECGAQPQRAPRSTPGPLSAAGLGRHATSPTPLVPASLLGPVHPGNALQLLSLVGLPTVLVSVPLD